MRIEQITDYRQKRCRVVLDNGTEWILYRGELRAYQLKEGTELSGEQYRLIQTEVIGKRAKKRALYLLERMDRTEAGLREKLCRDGYPPETVEEAIEYVRQYHYLDDARYAANYVRTYQDKRSRRRLMADLRSKGIADIYIEQALETEYVADETEQIRKLLKKKGYCKDLTEDKEKQRLYAFLMRRGFRSSDILKAMKCSEYLT